MIKGLLKIALSPVKAVLDTTCGVVEDAAHDPLAGVFRVLLSPVEIVVRTSKDISKGIENITNDSK